MGTAKDLPAPLPGLGHRYMIITEKMGCAGYRWPQELTWMKNRCISSRETWESSGKGPGMLFLLLLLF